jgi:hypothetical protein
MLSILEINVNLKKHVLEDQAISGRWRALAHKYARQLLHDESNIWASWQSAMVDAVAHILTAAGCTPDLPQVRELLRSKFGDRMSTIIRLTMRLRQALGEDITSADLEVVWILHGSTFDPATMEDDSGQDTARKGKDQQTDCVLCTTELGLRQSVWIGTKDGERSWKQTNLLKSKVTLQSIAEGMARYGTVGA